MGTYTAISVEAAKGPGKAIEIGRVSDVVYIIWKTATKTVGR